jgi:hypothetical protein
MKQTRLTGFNPTKVYESMLKVATDEQSKRLVEYAEQRIMMLGETISMYHSRHNMDDTGNLLDSLCWGVTYEGSYVGKGFYRPQTATQSSVLHEWSRNWGGEFFDKRRKEWREVNILDLPEIWGHKMAEDFLKKQEKKNPKGWSIFFAILAPYWGYWEKGFTVKGTGWGERFVQFAVMTQFCDHVRQDLNPAKIRFHVTNEIRYSNLGLIKQARSEVRRKDMESARRARERNKRSKK